MRQLLVLAIALALAAAACGDDSTSGIETTTLTAAVATTEAVATTTAKTDIDRARDAIAAWNSLDVGAFLSHFNDAGTIDGNLADTENVREQLGFYMTLGDVTEIQECELDARERAVCTAVTRDQLSGPAGMVHEGRWLFEFDDDGRIAAFAWFNVDTGKNDFIVDMVAWVETAYPEVWETSLSAGGRCDPTGLYNCHTTWYATPEAAAALLELGPEFIDQSEKYSLKG